MIDFDVLRKFCSTAKWRLDIAEPRRVERNGEEWMEFTDGRILIALPAAEVVGVGDWERPGSCGDFVHTDAVWKEFREGAKFDSWPFPEISVEERLCAECGGEAEVYCNCPDCGSGAHVCEACGGRGKRTVYEPDDLEALGGRWGGLLIHRINQLPGLRADAGYESIKESSFHFPPLSFRFLKEGRGLLMPLKPQGEESA